MIRTVEAKDLRMIAAIHKENFGDHFLGKFSKGLIAEFYSCFLGDENFIASFDDDGECQGFVLGGDSQLIANQGNNFIKGNFLRYAVEILFRPNTWGGAINRLVPFIKRLKKKKYSRVNKETKSSYSLLSIAVSKKFQRQGIATELVSAFERICTCDCYYLSVHANNVKAISFYKKIGMKEVPSNNKSIRFRKDLYK